MQGKCCPASEIIGKATGVALSGLVAFYLWVSYSFLF